MVCKRFVFGCDNDPKQGSQCDPQVKQQGLMALEVDL